MDMGMFSWYMVMILSNLRDWLKAYLGQIRYDGQMRTAFRTDSGIWMYWMAGHIGYRDRFQGPIIGCLNRFQLLDMDYQSNIFKGSKAAWWAIIWVLNFLYDYCRSCRVTLNRILVVSTQMTRWWLLNFPCCSMESDTIIQPPFNIWSILALLCRAWTKLYLVQARLPMPFLCSADMQKAIESENYSLAAELRDEISKLEVKFCRFFFFSDLR